MKTAFKIFSFCMILFLVSCEKEVLVPHDNQTGGQPKKSLRIKDVNNVINIDNSTDGSSEITDPNDRGGKLYNIYGGTTVFITDPTDGGNPTVKKPKR